MDYRLELLDPDSFERLVNTICTDLLGMGTVSFSKGKDGGRDGRFTGAANSYPSKASPWKGKFIIQSKHTSNPVASCSDKDFERLILDEEVPKIIELKRTNSITCYLIFTNRKYSGINGEKLLDKIKTKTKLTNVAIIGKSDLNDLYINQSPGIIKQFSLDKHHIPFDFSSEEIKEIILAMKQYFNDNKNDLINGLNKVKYDFDHLNKQEKNKKNKLGKDYYEQVILKHSLVQFDNIQFFLEADNNSELKDFYYDIVSELNHIITIKRDQFGAFEEIFSFIYQKICDGTTGLKGSKRHVLALLHYMYSSCEIGVK